MSPRPNKATTLSQIKVARKLVDLITSLKLTIVSLAAGMVLIFAGTLAQVHLARRRRALV
jgi:hypothetical protein